MNICKKCNSEVTKIPQSYISLNIIKNAKAFRCHKCQKYYDKAEIDIQPTIVYKCPYCNEYLLNSEHCYCPYCGMEIKKPLIKEGI